MAKALTKAKAGLPLNQRVWTWLKDHPKKTSKAVSAAVNVSQSSVASCLSDMAIRKMVIVEKDTSAHHARGGQAGFYSVSPRLKSFALLPRPKKGQKAPEAPAEAPAPPVRSKPTTDTMTAKEAFELYKELHAMFGGKAGA